MITNSDSVLYFKALADETRLNIISILSEESLCACDILEQFDFTQPTLSYHMKILVEVGIVNSSKDGNWTRYTLNYEILSALGEWIKAIPNAVEKKETDSVC